MGYCRDRVRVDLTRDTFSMSKVAGIRNIFTWIRYLLFKGIAGMRCEDQTANLAALISNPAAELSMDKLDRVNRGRSWLGLG